MVQYIQNRTEVVKVVPRDGALEITLNINLSVEGLVGQVAEGEVKAQSQPRQFKEPDVEPFVPEFKPGIKIDNFKLKGREK